MSEKINKPVYDDLDHLAGTWEKEDAEIFKKNTQFFEKIDKDFFIPPSGLWPPSS